MKKLFIIYIPILISISLNAQNPNFQWVKFNQGNMGSATAKSVEIDSIGNIHILGSFHGTVDFNPNLQAFI